MSGDPAPQVAALSDSGVRLVESVTRVLVVDDEPTVRRSLARMLLSRGMEVLTADDGANAFQTLERERIDVALVDLMMPNVGGLDLLAMTKAKGI